MRILVVGGGGREHAICWALKKSPKVQELYCAPGNGGIAGVAECVPIQVNQFEEIAQFAIDRSIDLVVIGPDDPLSEGIVDHLEAKQIAVFGPRKNAAIIEGSKVFTKQLLKKYNIPTAAYESFDKFDDAVEYLRKQQVPIVIKADGLAAGKGVVVAQTLEEAEKALHEIMVAKVFGESGNQVVIEEFLTGQEMSILAFVDGETVRPMMPAQDHKPVFDNDKGPNTGGMGTYTPLPHIPQSVIDESIETIIKPTAKAMVAEGRPFRGVLFAGLMLTPNGPKTIEFNARFGDPETQVVLPRLKTDLLDIFLAAVNGRLGQMNIEWSDEAAVCVILASEGYPGSYPKGLPIEGLDEVQDALVFHAGTAVKDGAIVTSGGRVLGVTALGRDIAEARAKAYAEADRIRFQGKHYRTDIAKKALV
ncbi:MULTISPECIES: phosphoribosylamine--glycine ligase [unclassified Paenibacillus]|uniref:phosphoribosylamine--glycine ligase n=1 Tax=unclassified Paenibacillus TaxID=185978 RepID=UPI001AE465D0|nr:MULTISPECIES: phosphoribosylamine--glycine ligase [unclassified Paenibacillus]MBP1153870.1 phosphoribosylamine--glycine ligase [Paenibacillus sp. PvP091]MBP1170745.1 phosphoribosylamine--glycine ligase [Paenibacillus sp. PvR098]MBP2441773.1 phosphoribosylamine--glycine ligase [Paenibacillus sp. PvP052]